MVMLKYKSYNTNMATPHKTRLHKILFMTLGALLLTGAILLILEKTNVINLYSSPSIDTNPTTTSSPTRPVNNVEYTPATPSDNSDITAKKNDGSIDAPTATTTQSNNPITVVLSAAGQDIKGGPVVVRSILSNLSGGVCTLTLTKDNSTKTYTANVEWLGTYYSCQGFDVPYTDLSVGEWQLTLSVRQDNNSGEASRAATVEAP